MAPKFLNLWGLKESNNNEAYDKGLISELTSNEAISEVISDLCSVVSFIVLDLVFDFTTNIRTLELTHVLGTVSRVSLSCGRKTSLCSSYFPYQPQGAGCRGANVSRLGGRASLGPVPIGRDQAKSRWVQ